MICPDVTESSTASTLTRCPSCICGTPHVVGSWCPTCASLLKVLLCLTGFKSHSVVAFITAAGGRVHPSRTYRECHAIGSSVPWLKRRQGTRWSGWITLPSSSASQPSMQRAIYRTKKEIKSGYDLDFFHASCRVATRIGEDLSYPPRGMPRRRRPRRMEQKSRRQAGDVLRQPSPSEERAESSPGFPTRA